MLIQNMAQPGSQLRPRSVSLQQRCPPGWLPRSVSARNCQGCCSAHHVRWDWVHQTQVAGGIQTIKKLQFSNIPWVTQLIFFVVPDLRLLYDTMLTPGPIPASTKTQNPRWKRALRAPQKIWCFPSHDGSKRCWYINENIKGVYW